MIRIGEIIKNRRRFRDLTQAGLADLLNVTPQAVSRWEMGISFPDIAMLPLISEALQITADELLGIRLTCRDSGADQGGELLNQSQADSIFDFIPPAKSDGHRKILIADDADFMRSILQDILTQQGHTVLLAKNGQECLHVLQNETVDVCLLDISMPVMDGLAALEKIRENYPGTRVVMLSACSTESNVRKALALGADAFIVKPFQTECLIERV